MNSMLYKVVKKGLAALAVCLVCPQALSAAGAADISLRPDAWPRGKLGAFAHYLTDGSQFTNNASFDVTGLVRQLKAMKPDYFFITLGQNSGFYCSPNETMERLAGVPRFSHCSKRDIPAEIIAALKGSGIRFGLYLPCQPANRDRVLVEGLGLSMKKAIYDDHAITEKGAENWAQVIEEWSRRYGRDVAYWWFDGAYEPCGFTEKHLNLYRRAVRAGNPEALMAFNAGVHRPGLASDFWAGEENNPLKVLPVPNGPNGKAGWQVLTFMGKSWARPDCRFPDEALGKWVREALARGGSVTLDMHIDLATGHLEQAQVDQFTRIRATLPAPHLAECTGAAATNRTFSCDYR